MILLNQIPFVKRAIVLVDSHDVDDIIEIYPARLVPGDTSALCSWLDDFFNVVLDSDADFICCFDPGTVRIIEGRPTPCVVVVVDSEKFEKGVTL